jgi:hypothetical protein
MEPISTMKTYSIYIKSHCEAPDYEDRVAADSKEEASKLFALRINTPSRNDYWEKDALKPYIHVEN